jgi:hypothetical protein
MALATTSGPDGPALPSVRLQPHPDDDAQPVLLEIPS